MSTQLKYILGGLVVALPLASFAFFGVDSGSLFSKIASAGYGGQPKVTICHKGKTLTVAEPAVQAHVNHGDTVGACV